SLVGLHGYCSAEIAASVEPAQRAQSAPGTRGIAVTARTRDRTTQCRKTTASRGRGIARRAAALRAVRNPRLILFALCSICSGLDSRPAECGPTLFGQVHRRITWHRLTDAREC